MLIFLATIVCGVSFGIGMPFFRIGPLFTSFVRGFWVEGSGFRVYWAWEYHTLILFFLKGTIMK